MLTTSWLFIYTKQPVARNFQAHLLRFITIEAEDANEKGTFLLRGF